MSNVLETAIAIKPSEKQLKWQQMEMYGFIHFGMNTFTDSEWGDGKADPQLFNPTELDALQWAQTAKAAGLKQLILTAKHHDGFCLWPSKYTDYSVKNSPWKDGKGDVVKELADACHEVGIKFGVYLSPWDRHEPSYGDSPAYNQFFLNQLEELLTQYGEVAEVWFDGACGEGPNGKQQEYDFPSYYELINKLQPDAVIAIMGPDVRWVGTEEGFGRLTEWSVLPIETMDPRIISANSQQSIEEGIFTSDFDLEKQNLGGREAIAKSSKLIWYPSEVDVSIRPGWFYHASQDDQVKSPAELMQIYLKSVGRNSTLLLNLPPDQRGLLHENDVRNLKIFGTVRESVLRHNFLDSRCITNEYTVLEEGEFREFILPAPVTTNCFAIGEYIKEGQAVEAFSLYAKINNEWQCISEATTIGFKRILTFPSIESDSFALKINQTRRPAYISHLGLHNLPSDTYLNTLNNIYK